MSAEQLIVTFYVKKTDITNNECNEIKSIIKENSLSWSETLFDNKFRDEYSITFKINDERIKDVNIDFEKIKNILNIY